MLGLKLNHVSKRGHKCPADIWGHYGLHKSYHGQFQDICNSQMLIDHNTDPFQIIVHDPTKFEADIWNHWIDWVAMFGTDKRTNRQPVEWNDDNIRRRRWHPRVNANTNFDISFIIENS